MSVHSLINQLIESNCGESTPKTLKRDVFQILLAPRSKEPLNSVKRLRTSLLARIRQASTLEKRRNCDELSKLTDWAIENLSDVEPVVILLLELENSVDDDYDDKIMPPFLARHPDPSLHSVYPDIRSIPEALPKRLQAPVAVKCRPMLPKDPVFSAEFPFTSTLAMFQAKELESLRVKKSNGASKSMSLLFETLRKERAAKPATFKEKMISSLSWESFGQSSKPKERLFASETDSLLHLLAIRDKQKGEQFDAQIIPLKKIIVDLKYLIVGIRSESFWIAEGILFEMKPNLTIKGVSPRTFCRLVDEFIDCGTCYKRLQILLSKDTFTFEPIFAGFVFKTLCESINSFLQTFRRFVLFFEDKTILGLSNRVANMMGQLIALAKMLGLHPKMESTKKLPLGSEFLGFLYREIINVTQHDISLFLLFILKNCCQIYFSNFEKWIFQGLLDDQCGELFVYFVDHYRTNTKHFFDKAYQIRRQSVPLFLQGYEEEILLCGKYTMLLKAYNPTHPIFSLPRLKLSVCLSYGDIDALRQSCEEYRLRAREVCGAVVSVREILKEKDRRRKAYLKAVEESSKRNMERWRAEQLQKAIEINQLRQEQREALEAQIEEVRQKKLAEKKANLEQELAYLREAQEVEDKRLLEEHQERMKRVEHYRELNRLIDDKHRRLQQVTDKLEEKLINDPSPSDHSSDALTPGDEEKSKSNPSISESVMNENYRNQVFYEPTPLGKSGIQKSESDLLNSNLEQTEFQRNRQRAMGSTIIDQLNLDTAGKETKLIVSLTDAERNKLKVLTQEHAFLDVENNILMERERIRQKVLAEEFGIVTEAQRNKKRVLGHDFAKGDADLNRNRRRVLTEECGLVEREQKKAPEKKGMQLDLESDLARNRRKVLESEFHILTGEQTKVPPAATTPMSVESEVSSVSTQDPREEENEEVNLRLDIGTDLLSSSFGVPDKQTKPTPESALNTAGVNERDGFIFEPLKPPSPAPIDLLDMMTSGNKENFLALRISDDEDEEKAPKVPPINEELQSLDVISLTHFLTSSLVLPLHTYFGVLNDEVLRLFLHELDIMSHFKSLRNYFFMMDGEFGSCVCDNLLRRLENGAKPSELLNYQSLHALLDGALGSSIIGNDKNADRLSLVVQGELPDAFELNSPNVLEQLSLSYQVSWPLNLILNPETLQQYGNVFKYLLKIRRIGWVLEEAFQCLKRAHRELGADLLTAMQYRRVQEMRHKLSQFVHALLNHITRAALQVSWRAFKNDLESTTTMEELYRKHVAYVKRILFLCMLNKQSAEFHNALEEIFKVVLKFYRYLKSKPFRKCPDGTFVHPRFDKMCANEKDFEKCVKFTVYLGNKLVRRSYQPEIGEFINLININAYYDPSH